MRFVPVNFVQKLSFLFYTIQTILILVFIFYYFSHIGILKEKSVQKVTRNSSTICNCTNTKFPSSLNQNGNKYKSTCSDEASEFGPGQKVISFSLFTPKSKSNSNSTEKIHRKFLIGLQENLELKSVFYSDWLIRVYSNIDLSISPGRDQLCPLICSHSDLFFCDVRNLPRLGNIDKDPDVLPMTWRFLPLGDATVWKFQSRDLDSRLSLRERHAVKQWENSGFPFHGMRDNPSHWTEVMGGMWGADNLKLGGETAKRIQRDILKGKGKSRNAAKFSKRKDWDSGITDQTLLTQIVYKKHKKLILTHDSFLCLLYKDSVPFPTRRNGFEFVGMAIFPDENGKTAPPGKLKACPVKCRPNYGKNWTFC